VMGLPAAKTMFGPSEPSLQRLRKLVEPEWVPQMLATVGLNVQQLPILWDADFILGPAESPGNDSYVLCEINASCITPFPPTAVPAIVAATLSRCQT